MAQQVINIGAAPNDGQGTPLRDSFDITNQNFTELYDALSAGIVQSIVAGAGISVDNTDPENPIVTNSSPDQTVVLNEGANITITGTYPNFTITGSDSPTAPVVSVNTQTGAVVLDTDDIAEGTTNLYDKIVSITGSGSTTITGTYPNFNVDSINTEYVAGSGIEITGTTIANTAPDQTVVITGTGAATITGTYPSFNVNATDTDTTYTAGSGLALTGTVFSNTAPDQTVVLNQGNNITITGTYPSFTIAAADAPAQGVSSIIAGSNISIDQSTGDVTISASGGASVMNAGTGTLSIVGSGVDNTASGSFSFVGGGKGNTASSFYSTVVAGQANTASGGCSFVGGGCYNTACGSHSFVGGGHYNTVNGNESFIGSGSQNNVNSRNSFIGSGRMNNTFGDYSFIGAGMCNSTSGSARYSFVGGGSQNNANSYYSSVIGGYSNDTLAPYSSIVGGSQNMTTSQNSHVIGSFLTGNAQDYTFVQNLCNVNGGTSDARLKENIQPLTFGLQELSQLDPVEYNFTSDESKKTKYGFLAQNIQSVMPSLITYHPTDLVDGEPVLQFDKDAVWSSMVNALKELQERVVKLENK